MSLKAVLIFLASLVLSGVHVIKSTWCETGIARDCQDILAMGMKQSGVYHVTPVGTVKGLTVYCDMKTDGGGWLVFQRRKDGSMNFYQDWDAYEAGFGNVSEEHWLGNLPLHTITHQGHYELRVDLEDWDGNTAFANYRYFRIDAPEKLYRIIVVGYFGNAGDSLGALTGQCFTTKDRDNDRMDEYNCAVRFDGAWWYLACHGSNLNALYLKGNHTSYANGINWNRWRGVQYSLKTTEMKIRRR